MDDQSNARPSLSMTANNNKTKTVIKSVTKVPFCRISPSELDWFQMVRVRYNWLPPSDLAIVFFFFWEYVRSETGEVESLLEPSSWCSWTGHCSMKASLSRSVETVTASPWTLILKTTSKMHSKTFPSFVGAFKRGLQRFLYGLNSKKTWKQVNKSWKT